MEPIELTRRGSDDVVAHACGVCLYVATSRDAAVACCGPRLCKDCGKDMGNSYCRQCHERDGIRKEAERFEKATKIPSAKYTGPLYVEGVGGGDYGDYYFSSEEVLRDHCDSEDCPVPGYAWACSPHRLTLDARSILSQAAEDHYEGALDSVPDAAVAEMSAYLDAWCERHPVTSWDVDYSRAVVLAPAWALRTG